MNVNRPASDPWLADASGSDEATVSGRAPRDFFDAQLAAAASPPPSPKRRKRYTRLFALAGALVVAAGATYGLLSARARQPHFETMRAERGHMTAVVAATGTLSAVTTVQVGTQVSGRVAELFADFNTPVKKGQPLATLDPQLLQAAVDQAQANYVVAQGGLATARAQMAHATRDLTRARSLWRQDLLTRQELDADDANFGAARGQLAAAKGTLAQAAAALHQARVNLGYTKILSPIDGVVVSRNVDVGQTVAASLQAPTLFTIAEDPRKMQVDTNVAEADVGKLTPGMKAAFRVDAFPGETFHGLVRQIRSAAQVVQNVVTYDAVIDFDNADLKLKPGMTANVTFVFAQKDDALKIPTAALRFRPPPALAQTQPLLADGERLVWAMRGGQPQPVRVRTGLTEGSATEVVEGAVSPGDALIIDVVGSDGSDGNERHGKKAADGKLKVF
jgi:HlyD family secretion protein